MHLLSSLDTWLIVDNSYTQNVFWVDFVKPWVIPTDKQLHIPTRLGDRGCDQTPNFKHFGLKTQYVVNEASLSLQISHSVLYLAFVSHCGVVVQFWIRNVQEWMDFHLFFLDFLCIPLQLMSSIFLFTGNFLELITIDCGCIFLFFCAQIVYIPPLPIFECPPTPFSLTPILIFQVLYNIFNFAFKLFHILVFSILNIKLCDFLEYPIKQLFRNIYLLNSCASALWSLLPIWLVIFTNPFEFLFNWVKLSSTFLSSNFLMESLVMNLSVSDGLSK